MTPRIHRLLALITVLSLAACGGETKEEGTSGGAENVTGETATMSSPKGSIAHQLALLKAGKTDALRACFTPRLTDRITADVVTKAQGEAEGMTLEDLFASSSDGEFEGKQTCKIKMKNGRTLTTLVLTDGKWLADTIWFR